MLCVCGEGVEGGGDQGGDLIRRKKKKRPVCLRSKERDKFTLSLFYQAVSGRKQLFCSEGGHLQRNVATAVIRQLLLLPLLLPQLIGTFKGTLDKMAVSGELCDN